MSIRSRYRFKMVVHWSVKKKLNTQYIKIPVERGNEKWLKMCVAFLYKIFLLFLAISFDPIKMES